MPNKRCFMYDRANVKISIVLPFGIKKIYDKSITRYDSLNLKSYVSPFNYIISFLFEQ